MRVFVHPRFRPLRFVLLTAIFLVVGARAQAQVSPLWDHYKVYFLNPPQTTSIPVYLIDQFRPYNGQVLALELFANPVEKRIGAPPGQVFPINDPLLHYSWWRISPQPFDSVVTATNQFGDHSLNLHGAAYLLNPALKNPVTGDQIPVKNHYLCYFCDGLSVNKDVTLIDQFDQWTATVTFPRFFCNPVAKTVSATQNYPIVDQKQHYICYEFQTEDPSPFTATMTDQFVSNRGLDLHPSRLLCVPTDKTIVTEAIKGTWGKLKLLYR